MKWVALVNFYVSHILIVHCILYCMLVRNWVWCETYCI